MHEREDLGIGRLSNSLAGVQEIEFHEEAHTRKLCTELLDEVGLRHRRATRGNQVVNNKHHIVFIERVGMNLEAVGSVFKLIAFLRTSRGNLPGLRAGTKPAPRLYATGAPIMKPRASAPTTLVMPASLKWSAIASMVALKPSGSFKSVVMSLKMTPGSG